MRPILKEQVQPAIESFVGQPVFLHLETTQGAYAARDRNVLPAGAYIRNGKIVFTHGKITGEEPFRVGLKIEFGWVYAEGLTHWEMDQQGRLLLAGHDQDGKLAVALQLSHQPF